MLETIFVGLFVVMMVTVTFIGIFERKLTNNHQNVTRGYILFYISMASVGLWTTSGIVLLVVGALTY